MPDCGNKFVPPLCDIRRTKCSQCKNQAFRPLDTTALEGHLRGHHTIGVYPLLVDGTCWFLALDFDDVSWKKDVVAVHRVCESLNLPSYVERSRSGDGAHLWLFFSEAISAMKARALGALLIARVRENLRTTRLRSFDRMFPSQDHIAQGAFGNLIALPLQRLPRKSGNTVFVNGDLEPYPGQWQLLASVDRINPERLARALELIARNTASAERSSGTTKDSPQGDLFSLASSDVEPQTGSTVQDGKAAARNVTLQARLRERIFISRQNLPEELQARIRSLAMFSNPEYFRRRAARASTWRTPRVLQCSEVTEGHIALPRGCEPRLTDLAADLGIGLVRIDERSSGVPAPLQFQGTLTPLQARALGGALAQDSGILVLPTGTGKTVVSCAAIAARSTSTLVLVNRRPLLDQWRAQLSAFLDLSDAEIGEFGGRKRRPNGRLDIATVQSLVRRGNDDALGQYGLVVVDECHHAASSTFEGVLSRIPAKYFLGLTATPTRRDGHQPIMHMQLGPIVFEVSAKDTVSAPAFARRYFVRRTELADERQPEKLGDLQARLFQDERRNSFILDDAIAAIRDGRSPLLLCQRREHVLWFAERLERYAPCLFVLMGGESAHMQRERLDALRVLPTTEQRTIVATGGFIGEGLDDPRLDTLLLAAPISWRGMLAQYVGRLHRHHPGKDEVWVFDYVDTNVPVLEKMFKKRASGYRALGYTESNPPDDFELLGDPSLDGELYWEDDDLVHDRNA